MSAVTEWVVREYFESLGFLVRQPRKYSVPGRQKRAEEEADLLIVNPHVDRQVLPERLVWTADEVRGVARAVVGVCGWHTDRFYASTFEQSPDLLRFAEADSLQIACKLLGTADIAKILCIPRLPASGDLKKQTIEALRTHGIDGVISFRTLLLELVRHVDVNRNYDKSDLLQTIRLLKNYDLLKNEQLELFDRGLGAPIRSEKG